MDPILEENRRSGELSGLVPAADRVGLSLSARPAPSDEADDVASPIRLPILLRFTELSSTGEPERSEPIAAPMELSPDGDVGEEWDCRDELVVTDRLRFVHPASVEEDGLREPNVVPTELPTPEGAE